MPGMNAVGTNTEANTSAIPTTGPESSFIAFIAASFGASPSSIWRCTPSTTAIASSTTNPIARTRPNIDSVLMEKPNSGNSANVPTSETGTASIGIRVARQRSEEHTSELQSRLHLVCRLLLEKKKTITVLTYRRSYLPLPTLSLRHAGLASGPRLEISGHINLNLTITLHELSGLAPLVILMAA